MARDKTLRHILGMLTDNESPTHWKFIPNNASQPYLISKTQCPDVTEVPQVGTLVLEGGRFKEFVAGE